MTTILQKQSMLTAGSPGPYADFYSDAVDVERRLQTLTRAIQNPFCHQNLAVFIEPAWVWRLRWRWPYLCRVIRYRVRLAAVPCPQHTVSVKWPRCPYPFPMHLN